MKKELLVAMEAIDELFNANQVNLQMLAVTPAVLALLSIQNVWRLLTSAIRATSRGRVMESISMVHRDIRMYIREMERVLLLADADNTRSSTAALIEPNTPKRLLASPSSKPSASKELQLSFQALTGHEQTLSSKDMGRLMSLLYRIQLLLLVHASNFEVKSLNQFQEDLRDITTSHLSIGQRLQIIERIYRVYSFMQPSKGNNLFGGGLLQ